ncbi:Hypothetical protein EMIHUDRAFT_370876, partial [Emiliania huxleyi CCMP1516]|uniref:Uncharacterized protein n=2 Tax=Emiliania huxleyi TaxID=2903 RepID=A0A0D3ISR3_EMIH1
HRERGQKERGGGQLAALRHARLCRERWRGHVQCLQRHRRGPPLGAGCRRAPGDRRYRIGERGQGGGLGRRQRPRGGHVREAALQLPAKGDGGGLPRMRRPGRRRLRQLPGDDRPAPLPGAIFAGRLYGLMRVRSLAPALSGFTCPSTMDLSHTWTAPSALAGC